MSPSRDGQTSKADATGLAAAFGGWRRDEPKETRAAFKISQPFVFPSVRLFAGPAEPGHQASLDVPMAPHGPPW